MKGLFPLWKRDTVEIARRFIGLGFEAVVVCVDSTLLDGTFVGWVFDERFLLRLPSIVDPCGENGEFHSFVYDDPIFRWTVPSILREIVLRRVGFTTVI